MGAIAEVTLDVTGWRDQEDFYRALLHALGAPAWHGHNLDALWDSIYSGDINEHQPKIIRFVGKGPLPEELASYVQRFIGLAKKAAGEDVDIRVEAEPATGLRA